MRTIPDALKTQYGTRIEVSVVISGTTFTNLISVPAIDSLLSVDNVETYTVDITLDDTDGAFKAFIDGNDIQKVDAELFVGTLSLFKGQIFGNVQWSDNDRTVSLKITSRVESQEYGFSPERGQLDYLSEDAIGQAWPLVFGSPRYVPMVRAYHQPTAVTEDRFCVVDPKLYQNRRRLMNAYNQSLYMFGYFDQVIEDIISKAQSLPHIEEAKSFTDLIFGTLARTNIVSYQNFYLDLIAKEDELQVTVWQTASELEYQRNKNEINNDRGSAQRIVELEQQINSLAITANENTLKKQAVEYVLDQLQVLYEAEKNAVAQQLSWLNNAYRAYSQFVTNEETICEQERCVKETIRIRGAELPTGTQSVIIDNIKYSTSTTGNLLTFIGGPKAVYENVTPDAWTEDDDPCNFAADSQNLIRVPTGINLRGMYLLVKKVNGLDNVRHVVKVTEQIGTKVYFKLVPWKRDGSGGPRGQSIESFINSVIGIDRTHPSNNPYDFGSSYGGYNWGDYNINWGGGYDPAFATDSLRSELRDILVNYPNLTQEELTNVARFMVYRRLDNLSQISFQLPGPADIYTLTAPFFEVIEEAAGKILPHWFDNYYIPPEELTDETFIDAPAGSEIRFGDECEVHVANILESTVHALHAYREDNDGNRVLDAIPSSYYSVVSKDLGKYPSVTTIVFDTPLSRLNEKWENTIYCTQTSSVGRNVVSVVDWLMTTYTDLTASNDISSAVAAYPVDFALFETGDVLSKVKEILYQSRIGLRTDGTTYELIYLPATPSSAHTLTGADYIRRSLVEVQGNTTVTAFHGSWNGGDYLPKEVPYEYVIRNNVNKYGYTEAQQEYQIYSVGSLVEKSLQFNALRGSFSWERVSLRVTSHLWGLQPFDAVTFNGKLHLVQSAKINVLEGTMDLVLHTGTIAGETDQFEYFWPAAADDNSWIRNDVIEVTGSIK